MRGPTTVFSDTSDLKIGAVVATVPGVWHGRVSATTGWPAVTG